MSELNPFGFREVLVQIDEIKLNEKNPRKISRKEATQLSKSIEKFGLVDKPILNKDLSCIAGHQRILIRKAKGDKQIPCMVPEIALTQEEAEEFLLRHNKNTGSWDEEKLFENFSGDLLKSIGFSETFIKEVFHVEEVTEPVYPLSPRPSEKYDYVMIITDNDVNFMNLMTILGLEVEKDFKSSYVGTGKVITYEKFKQFLDERNT